MKTNLRKTIVILFSVMMMCSTFGAIGVKAQPIVLVEYPDFIGIEDEIISIIAYFEYENIYQRIKDDICLYYVVNEDISTFYTHIKTYTPDSSRPEEMLMEISTSELNLKYGDKVGFAIVFNWGNLVKVQGTFVYEGEINVSQPVMWLQLPNFIAPNEDIYVTIRFSYNYETMVIKDNIDLYYNVNNLSDFHKIHIIDTDRPEKVVIIVSTSDLNLKYGDIITFRAICNWGDVGSTKGTLTCKNTINASQPVIKLSNLPDSILPTAENISLTIKFLYDYETMIIRGAINLYYNIDNQNDFHKSYTLDKDRPKYKVIFVSLLNLNLINESVIRFKIVCDWGDMDSIKGTIIDEDTVDVYEYEEEKTLPVFDYSIRLDILIISIAVPILSILLIITTIFVLRRRRKKKFKKQLSQDLHTATLKTNKNAK